MRSNGKLRITVLTGAGISAQSGIATFRGGNGLWENYRIEEVATPEAWQKNPQLVTDFYNARRQNVLSAKPNKGHLLLKEMGNLVDLQIITQNIDDLHERAGCNNILHLHGEIMKMRSQADESVLLSLTRQNAVMSLNDLCPYGLPWRPHVVWFGEAVPAMEQAIAHVRACDIFIVIGTSLAVYPAAGLIHYVPSKSQVYLIDPDAESISTPAKVIKLAKNADEGLMELLPVLFNLEK